MDTYIPRSHVCHRTKEEFADLRRYARFMRHYKRTGNAEMYAYNCRMAHRTMVIIAFLRSV